MKVLYIEPNFWGKDDFGGDGRSLLDTIHSVKGDVEPSVLFATKGNMYNMFVSDGINCYLHPFNSVMAGKRSWKHLLFHPWRTRFGKWFHYELPCIVYALRIIRREQIDLIHTNNCLSTLGWTLQRFFKVKHVWHIRENGDSSYLGRPIVGGRKRIEKYVNQADARIFSSRNCLDNWNPVKKNSYAILDAVRSIDDCCYIKSKQPYFLFCSHWISEAKGAFVATRAFCLSGLAKEGVHLKMVGRVSNRMNQLILSMAGESGCEDSIEFVTLQDDVKPFFANALAFVQPSVNEGMGRTTAEAMFFGCPVIARGSGGTLDLIKNGETGWLFNTDEECAELMRKVYYTDQEQIIIQAQEFAKENLSIENYREKLLTVYNTVLGS